MLLEYCENGCLLNFLRKYAGEEGRGGGGRGGGGVGGGGMGGGGGGDYDITYGGNGAPSTVQQPRNQSRDTDLFNNFKTNDSRSLLDEFDDIALSKLANKRGTTNSNINIAHILDSSN